jgi:hypothetical protein
VPIIPVESLSHDTKSVLFADALLPMSIDNISLTIFLYTNAAPTGFPTSSEYLSLYDLGIGISTSSTTNPFFTAS